VQPTKSTTPVVFHCTKCGRDRHIAEHCRYSTPPSTTVSTTPPPRIRETVFSAWDDKEEIEVVPTETVHTTPQWQLDREEKERIARQNHEKSVRNSIAAMEGRQNLSDQANFHRNRHPGRVTFTEAEKEEAYLNGHCTNTAQIKDY
jgi:hypothetical protein